jgi:carboxyl-terminal processing protease
VNNDTKRSILRWIRIHQLGAVFLLALSGVFHAPGITAPSLAGVYQELWETVRDNFYDPKLRGLDWQAIHERYAPLVDGAQTTSQFATIVNQMLGELRTSHTHYYTSQDPEYFQLAGIFWPVLEHKLKPFLRNGRPDYAGIGIFTVSVGGKTFVSSMLSGFPGAIGGLRLGDEILFIDGKPFEPIESFAGKAGQAVSIEIQRTPDGSSQKLSITPKLLDATKMFLDAMKASVEVVSQGRAKIGYVHIWSYAGETYQHQLEEELDGRLHDCDGLVLDLRDGWGGASPSYLRPFLVPPMTTVWQMRDGKRQTHEEAWTKPVCLVVNQGTRSGKELLTCYFKKAHRGLVVGSRTAGAGLPGKPFVLSDGSVLLLAVGDGFIDGKRLEGNGISPDVEVPFPIAYANGSDPQKMRAIELVAQAVRHQ